MEFYWSCLLFWLGVSVGSFLNMLLYRTEMEYKLRKKLVLKNSSNRSFCDFCGNKLSWYENIPIFSWLVLRGKSLCCHKQLPYLYPLLELSLGIIFASLISHLLIDSGILFLLKLIIISFLLFSAIFDLKHMILPDFSTYILVTCSVLIWLIGGSWDLGFIYAGIGSLLFLLFLNLVTKGNGMGMGDVKYVLFMGFLLGVTKTILAFYIAFIGGALVGMIMILFYKKKKNSRMPFGPFLITATLISWFWGDKLLLYFYSWF